ncbi:MAG: 4Fe-4S dicluster domain-containing protein [Bryobacteraceae bacterium]|nr:4Fe-4S dicluster domain-containing protein [Bryobacteraceae bacterium]
MSSYGWLLDPKRCIECGACEAACKQWNDVPVGVNVRWRRVLRQETGRFPDVRVTALSMACCHCENALCQRVCPARAIWRRDDGIVLVDSDRCIGCGQCYAFCPVGAPQRNASTRKTTKCTMCFDRIEQGLQPACSTACPTGALQWGEWKDIEGKGSDRLPGFAYPRQMRPRIRFVTEAWR